MHKECSKFSSLHLFLYLFIGLLILCIFPFRTQAASSSSIVIDVNPQNPAPYEDTTITLSSYEDNLDSVLIAWSQDGKNVLSGIGKKSFIFKAPAASSSTTIVVDMSFPDGAVEKRIVIKPGVMILLWQAEDSYVPPFYKGKAMPSPDSDIKVVAMPEIRNSTGGSVSPQNLTYDWQKDYNNSASDSGYGKNYLIYKNDYLESSNNISVTASTVDGQASSNSSIDIGATDPKISFYKMDKNLGTIWEQSLSDPHRVVGGETVVAIPYFMSPKNLQTPSLVFNWTINDNPVSVPIYRKNVIPLKVQEGTSGTSKLHLDIENSDRLFQGTSQDINIQF